MDKLTIATKSKTYPMYIGTEIIDQLPKLIQDTCKQVSKILVISDESVAELYLDKVLNILKQQYDEPLSFVIPAGENAKSFDVYYQCQTFALEKGLDRTSVILALGGGVVGDLAGFVAATFMRGIPFIQIPTTLLAHDSAVGGKVAINHELGKNMIGAFHQPNAVLYDIELMKTLPRVELRSGFAEVIKHGLIWDREFYRWLTEEIQSLEDLKGEKLQYAVLKGVAVKARVVSEDEQEKGLRAILNFGHTLGHAIEAESGYGRITHGDGVAIGMIFALKVSEKIFHTNLSSEKIREWFRLFEFPTAIPEGLDRVKLLERMKHDKKATSGKVKMVLLKNIGETAIEDIGDEQLLQFLKEFH
ncbi:3-dehydroquinate synthase [Fredinandcohnia sp. QZ13]|uniref:3-dehydroquinate synthase n=1 Tax=Fredinandcohnia sp. QZ13 TaxID=3073144 RepID=UPI00285321A2|nr:3-dehydroquinate synthase [Fredinandcohnia sp. QZ13]MDR4888716.1 3-dehydroquinate synthase [Fredinandcohnia sp. QZ13]